MFLKRMYGTTVKNVLRFFGYRYVIIGGMPRIEKNRFFDEFLVYQGRLNADAPVIFDVGAHVGDSAFAYTSRFPSAVIHCFEPTTDSFEKLSRRYYRHLNVRLNKMALGDEDKDRDLFVFGECSTGNSLIPPSAENVSLGSEPVRVGTIDQYCNLNDVNTIHILKIDVQGSELDVLWGAKGMFSRNAVVFVRLEVMFHGFYSAQSSFGQIDSFLTDFGYVLIDICDLKKSSSDRRTMMADLIYGLSSLVQSDRV